MLTTFLISCNALTSSYGSDEVEGKVSLDLESDGFDISISNCLYYCNCSLTSLLDLCSFSILVCIVDVTTSREAISPHLVFLPRLT